MPNDRAPDVPYSTLKHLLAGGISGCCAKTVCAPLDRIKILFQVRSPHYSWDKGVFATVRAVAKFEKPSALWRGNGAQLARVFPYAAVNFFTFEGVSQRLRDAEGALAPHNRFLAGATSGVTSTLLTYPLDLVRASLAANVINKDQSYSGVRLGQIRRAVIKITRQDGVRALYHGFGPTLLGVIPYGGLSFLVFGQVRLFMTETFPQYKSPIMTAMCGGFAGAVAQTVTYPIDVVRRRMQLLGAAATVESALTDSTHLIREVQGERFPAVKLFTRILEVEGWRALYRGLSINYLRVMPSVGLAFTVHDFLKKRMGLSKA